MNENLREIPGTFLFTPYNEIILSDMSQRDLNLRKGLVPPNSRVYFNNQEDFNPQILTQYPRNNRERYEVERMFSTQEEVDNYYKILKYIEEEVVPTGRISQMFPTDYTVDDTGEVHLNYFRNRREQEAVFEYLEENRFDLSRASLPPNFYCLNDETGEVTTQC